MTAKYHVTEHTAIKDVAARLAEAFSPALPGDQVHETVQRIHRAFDGSKIRDFVPLLVENAARDELRRRAQAATDPAQAPAPSPLTR